MQKTPNTLAKKSAQLVLPVRTWKLQDAKARFSEVCRLAEADGPQRVTRQGKETMVVIAETEYQSLGARSKPKSLWEIFKPLVGTELRLERDRTPMREIDL